MFFIDYERRENNRHWYMMSQFTQQQSFEASLCLVNYISDSLWSFSTYKCNFCTALPQRVNQIANNIFLYKLCLGLPFVQQHLKEAS